MPKPQETEREMALKIADSVLDTPYIDPDGDIAILARQLIRAQEEINLLKATK